MTLLEKRGGQKDAHASVPLRLLQAGTPRECANALFQDNQGAPDYVFEVVCEGTDDLLRLVDETIRGMDQVRSADAFTYLHLAKQTYAWGTP